MKVLIEIEYKGTNYCGWQIQKNGVSIQQILQEKLSEFFDEKIILFASGRTDAGVHARKQFAHFELDKKFDVSRLPFAMQNILPEDISIKKAMIVPDNFHARYSVISKTYYYRMYQSKIKEPLKEDTFLQIKDNLDVNTMKKACKYFVGTHNFKAFCVPRNLDNENFNRRILKCNIECKNNDIVVKITGEGFLHNMVRIIVGTLILVGQGKIMPKEIKNIIESGDRAKAGKTVCAKGLTLEHVYYGDLINKHENF